MRAIILVITAALMVVGVSFAQAAERSLLDRELFSIPAEADVMKKFIAKCAVVKSRRDDCVIQGLIHQQHLVATDACLLKARQAPRHLQTRLRQCAKKYEDALEFFGIKTP